MCHVAAKRKAFEQKRKVHYNEFEAVKLARKLLEKDDDEELVDDEEEAASSRKAAKGSRKSDKKAKKERAMSPSEADTGHNASASREHAN